MTTFIQGVQKLATECGLASSPSTVVSQTGEFARLVEWYKDAYIDIQNRHQDGWRWLRHSFTLTTSASDDAYTYSDCTDSTSASAISRFGCWKLHDPYDPPKIYLSSAGVGSERWLIWLPWEDFKLIYKIGSQSTTTGQPAHITVDPQNNILLGPSPNDVYVVTGDYYRSAQELSVDADEPEMPSQFHNLITWAAMMDYGNYEVAQEVLNRGHKKYRSMLRKLEANQLTSMRIGGPLV